MANEPASPTGFGVAAVIILALDHNSAGSLSTFDWCAVAMFGLFGASGGWTIASRELRPSLKTNSKLATAAVPLGLGLGLILADFLRNSSHSLIWPGGSFFIAAAIVYNVRLRVAKR